LGLDGYTIKINPGKIYDQDPIAPRYYRIVSRKGAGPTAVSRSYLYLLGHHKLGRWYIVIKAESNPFRWIHTSTAGGEKTRRQMTGTRVLFQFGTIIGATVSWLE